MAILDGPGFFRNTVLPSLGGANPQRRIPFAFTSTARLIKSGKLKAVGSQFAREQNEEDQKRELAIIEKETRGPAVAAQLGLSSLLGTVQNAGQVAVGVNMPVVNMVVNPQTIKWDQGKRFSKRDTMEGSTFFHFTNSNDQNNDILTCTFTGKTGNINTQAQFGDVVNTGANLKLRTWHELYNLSREPLLLNKLNTGLDIPHGTKNEFYISYRTVLMPIQITLIGFFSKVLEFTESSSDPYNRDYSFTFTVTDTSPDLDSLADKINTSLTTVGAAKSLGSDITALSDNGGTKAF